MNFDLYEPLVRERGASALRGKFDHLVPADSLRGPAVIDAFLDDDDVQEISVCSSNLGFARTITKSYRKRP